MYCTVYTHENRLKRAKPCVQVSKCVYVAMFVFISAEIKKMKKMSKSIFFRRQICRLRLMII